MILASALESQEASLASPPVEKLESEAFDPIPESEEPSDYIIRANQGHSIKVDTDGLLEPITVEAKNVPEVCVHGTDESAWKLILKGGGLRRMGRNHIHFAAGLPAGFKSLAATELSTEEKEAPPVISGMRKSSTVLIYIDIEAAMASGIKFHLSENGVILSEGNDKGFLPSDFFKRVESRKRGGGILMKDGILPEGTVVDFEAWEKEVGGGGKKGGGRGGKGKGKVNDDSRDLLAGV